MQEYGIITTLPYSKYSSPIFEQRKPNGKLRILVDLRRINHLLKKDYKQHNHPVTTIADAANTWQARSTSARSVVHRPTIASRWLTNNQSNFLRSTLAAEPSRISDTPKRGLNRSLSAFNSTIREYLDALGKAERYAQYVDDIGVAANSVDELVGNIETVFQQIQKARLKLSMSKCAFGHPKIELLGRSITTKGIAPLEDRINNLDYFYLAA